MIARAALGLAVLLVSVPLGGAMAADWDGTAQGAHRHARMHHGHHHHHARLHHGHHRQHLWAPRAHRRVLYRNPAYSARWVRPSAGYGWNADRHHAYRTSFSARPVAYGYAYPVTGSYLGGGLIGALYNQPSCYCR